MSDAPTADLPLSGTRVLDFTRLVAGPFATQILGDLGAEVIKVEPPGGDMVRGYDGSTGTQFATLNRNKLAVTLDLKDADDRELAYVLAAASDVVIHNFRGGVAERLGIAYEDLMQHAPTVIYCSLTGFGSFGPRWSFPAVDLIAQAYSGLLSYTGEPSRDPVRVPLSIADLTTGLYAAIGVLAGLQRRDRTGEGMVVETSLLESLLSLEAGYISRYRRTGQNPQPMGSQNVGMGLPNQVFTTKDGKVAVAAVTNDMWRQLCVAIDAPPALTSDEFATVHDRAAQRAALVAQLEAIFSGLNTEDCCERLSRAGVIHAPVMNIEEVLADPQVRELDILRTVESGGTTVDVVRSPLRVDGHPLSVRRHPPPLGSDNDAVLSQATRLRERNPHARFGSSATEGQPPNRPHERAEREPMTSFVNYQQDGRIVYLELNRPEKLNAVNQEMVDELLDALYRIDADGGVWVAVLSGSGRGFCSGADVESRIATPRALGFSPAPTINVLLSRFRNYKPVIAATHGWAVGAGMVLTMHSDLVVADETTKFQVSEVNRGIDGTVLWAPLDVHVTGGFADELALTGRVCGAQEAYERGFVHRVVPEGTHLDEATKLAHEIMENPPLSVRSVVRARRTRLELLTTAVNIQTRDNRLAESEDFKEAVAAFKEKRKPVFHGR